MREFEADIGRDGTVYHRAWTGHAGTAEHFNLPENTSLHRQNYFEFDLRAPFTDTLGLQERGIEDPPEVVIQAAKRLSQRLQNWHRGRDLRTIPEDWGDVVEHVYEIRGDRTPKYLNGRGGVYFVGEVDVISDGRIERLLGSVVVHKLTGTAVVAQMWGRSRIERMEGDASVESTWQSARIESAGGRSRIAMLCQSSSVGLLEDEAQVHIMHGATRVESIHGSAFCVRGADGSVNTPDGLLERSIDLSSNDRWKRVNVVSEGDAIYA